MPPHAGKRPRKTSGKAKCRTAVDIVRAVQCKRELDATAEACAVDRRDGRERQRAQAPEQLVSRTCAFDRAVTRDVGNSVMSAPAAKKNGLPVITAAL